MTDFCSTWRNQTWHPLIDFKACRCDGEDITGFSAHQGCTLSVGRMVGIVGPFILIAVIFWVVFRIRGVGVLEDICDCTQGMVVLLCPEILLGMLLHWLFLQLVNLLKWCSVYGDVCVDRLVCHPLIQSMRLAMKRSPPSAPIAQHPILPRELCDIIISFCEDKSLLLSCSLVCVAWMPMSRKQLRMQLRLTTHERSIRLSRLLRSPLETLSSWVDWSPGIELGWKSYRQQWRLLHLLKLKGFQLQTATISGCGRLAPHLLHIYPDLQSLTFHVVRLPRNMYAPDELRAFLTTVLRFKHLCSLTIEIDKRYYFSFLDNRKWNANTSGTLPISRLSLGGEWVHSLLTWLQSRCRRLETLDIHTIGGWPSGSQVSILELLMRSNWQTLKHLHLTVFPDSVPLNLSSLKRLTSIHLSLQIEQDPTFSSIDCAMKTLQTLDRPHPSKELIICLQSSMLSFAHSDTAAFDATIVRRLGLMPVTRESRFYSYATETPVT